MIKNMHDLSSGAIAGNSLLLMLFPLVLIAADARAHHSESIYERGTVLTIEGTIVRYDWRNPHVYLWVEEKAGEGEPVVWQVEGQPPAILKRHGWTRDRLELGEAVVVKGRPGRDTGRNVLLLQTIATSGGGSLSMETLFTQGAEADEAVGERAASLAGTWATLIDYAQLARLVQPRNLALTPQGLAALEAFDEAADSPAIECVPYTAPILMLAPDIKQIRVESDRVVIRGEFEATERTVYLNVDSHDGVSESIQGHSIGRWEDGALVIDTRRFLPHRQGIANGLPSGPGKQLIERLRLSPDGSRLLYSFELEDTEYLAEPVKGEDIQWSYRPDLAFEALPCDLETARRFVQ